MWNFLSKVYQTVARWIGKMSPTLQMFFYPPIVKAAEKVAKRDSRGKPSTHKMMNKNLQQAKSKRQPKNLLNRESKPIEIVKPSCHQNSEQILKLPNKHYQEWNKNFHFENLDIQKRTEKVQQKIQHRIKEGMKPEVIARLYARSAKS